MKKIFTLLLVLCFVFVGVNAQKKVAYVYGKSSPAPDVRADTLYQTLLKDINFSVDTVQCATGSYKSTKVVNADLVILSEHIGSTAAGLAEYRGINKPMLNMKDYAYKKNASSFSWMMNATASDTTFNDASGSATQPITHIRIDATQKGHPIFAGVTYVNSDSVKIFNSVTHVSSSTGKALNFANINGFHRAPFAIPGTITNMASIARVPNSSVILEIAPGTVMRNFQTASYDTVKQRYIQLGYHFYAYYDTANVTPDGIKIFVNSCYYLLGLPAPGTHRNVAYVYGKSSPAPDVRADTLYQTLLKDGLFTVDTVQIVTGSYKSAKVLNADLVILSEHIGSTAAGLAEYRGINKPMLNMKDYAYKKNASSFSWMMNATASDTTFNDASGSATQPITHIRIDATQKSHTIFTGITYLNNDSVKIFNSVTHVSSSTGKALNFANINGFHRAPFAIPGTITSMASIARVPNSSVILEIAPGTVMRNFQTASYDTVKQKYIQLGYHFYAYYDTANVTSDGIKIFLNSCYYLLGYYAPTSKVLVTGIAVAGAAGATTITTAGGTLQMNATITPVNASNQNVTWSVDNTAVGTISSTSGLLTAAGNGTVTVTATANDGSGVKGTAAIVISNQTAAILVTSITVTGAGSATTITAKGGTLQMSAAVLPANATDKTYAWSVDKATVATIDATGLLTAMMDGKVAVKATAHDASGKVGVDTITISGQAVAGVKSIAYITDPNASTYSYDTVIYPRLKKNTSFSVTEVPIGNVTGAGDLSSFDMVLFSEVPGSGAAQNIYFKGINKPFLNMKVHIYKSSVWNWTMGYGQDAAESTIVVADKTHPIFKGITFSGSNNDEVVLLSSVLSSKGLTWVFPANIKTTGGAVKGLASMKSASTKFSIIEIPAGAVVSDSTGGGTVTINQKWLQIGISSASDQTVTPDAYKIIENACNYLLGTVGVKEIAKADIIVSPNPVSDVLNVSHAASLKQIKIVNLQGQVVMTITNASDNAQINVSGLKPGMYILKSNGIVKKFTKL